MTISEIPVQMFFGKMRWNDYRWGQEETQSDKHIEVNYCGIKLEWLIFYSVSQIKDVWQL